MSRSRPSRLPRPSSGSKWKPVKRRTLCFEYLEERSLLSAIPTSANLMALAGTGIPSQPAASAAGSFDLSVLANFNSPNGAGPTGGVIADSHGNLFGTTTQGGVFGYGTVFEVKVGSGKITTLASFNSANGACPMGRLVEDSSGNLFGTTASGGAFGAGTVFEIKAGSGAITTLASFNGINGDQPNGGMVEDSRGNLFGTTCYGGASNYGTVFEVKAGSGVIVAVASFNGVDGQNPGEGLVADSRGNLFGTTGNWGVSGDGTVFEVEAGSGAITTLVSFNGTNGEWPSGGLIQDSGGNLFGATYSGGEAGYGTVFEVVAGSGAITTLASFDGDNGAWPNGGLVEDSGGNLFGTTRTGGATGDGAVFEVKAGSGDIAALASFESIFGEAPDAGVFEDSSGNLFGTTNSGSLTFGKVFEVKAGSGVITRLAAFGNGNGILPAAGLTQDSNGDIFGATGLGGALDFGTVFEVNAGSGAVTTLASFDGINGTFPNGGLIEDSRGNLFGTAGYGSASGGSSVFEIKAGSGTITTLASFNGINGAFPNGGLIEDSSGNLFGTTGGIGSFSKGTVFEVKAGSGTITILASFDESDGNFPNEGLVEDSRGNLFGTTAEGGAYSDGTVFEITAGSGTITTLASFDGTNGVCPGGGLIEDSGGNLFGTTAEGGAYSDGTVFEITAGSGTITTLASFDGTDGMCPSGGLIEDNSGNLWGTAQGGASGYGMVFEVRASSGIITMVASFNGTNGAYPSGGLIENSRGEFFGVTSRGLGLTSEGAVFELINRAPVIASISPASGPASAGTTVTITGANLTKPTSVMFGNLPAKIKSSSATQIVVVSPAETADTVDITVTTARGTSVPCPADCFTYVAAPSVSTVSPAQGPLSGGGKVTITGSGFTGVTAVTFGRTRATSFTVDSSTQITAIIPAGKPGTADVTVVAVGGTSRISAKDAYTYFALPVVSKIAVSGAKTPGGSVNGGTAVTITGKNFLSVVQVMFGSVPATSFIVNSDTSLTVISPKVSTPGAVDITVTSVGGTSSTSSKDRFIYTPAALKVVSAGSVLDSALLADITSAQDKKLAVLLLQQYPERNSWLRRRS